MPDPVFLDVRIRFFQESEPGELHPDPQPWFLLQDELNDWLETMLVLQHGKQTHFGKKPKPNFDIIWQVVLLSTIHSNIHSFIHPTIHTFFNLSILPFIHSSIYPFIHLSIYQFIHSFIYLFIPFIHSFKDSFIHPSFHSFIHSSIHSFIYSSIH